MSPSIPSSLLPPPPREPHQVTHTSRSAFTLLELLLAVAIFAVVLLAIHTVFHSALTLRNRTTSQVDASIPLQHTLEIIRRDLANLVPPGGTFSGPFQSPVIASGFGPASGGSSNVYRAVLPGRVVSPEFHTTTGLLNEQLPWGEIARVTYYLADPTNHTAGLTLMRSVTHNLLPVVEDQSDHQPLLDGVADLAFLYFDGYQWIDYWDSTTAATPLPGALKVQLHLAAPGIAASTQRRDPIELIVPIQVHADANPTSEAESEPGGGS
jgi:prepilin-type N-terminal cleavage/methylation domain-containing protein